MMSMFRKFSLLLKNRVCGALFTICLISPLFVISASAVSVEFMSSDGSESYGSTFMANYFSLTRIETPNGIEVFVDYGDADCFQILTGNIVPLGFSYEPNSSVADFGFDNDFWHEDIDYGGLDPEVDILPLYLAYEGAKPPVVTPETEFTPLARPSGWTSNGEYNIEGKTPDYTFKFPSSYPDQMQTAYLGTGFSSYNPQIALAISHRLNVYYNFIVRQAVYFANGLPETLEITGGGFEGTFTIEKILTEGGVDTYNIAMFENTVTCKTIVDKAKNIVYFDYNISVFLPDTLEDNMHAHDDIVFYLKHENGLCGLDPDDKVYTSAVSVYCCVSALDETTVLKYKAFEDKSQSQIQQGQDLIKDIESLVKPDPEQILPDYLPDQEQLQPITDAFSPFFQNALIVQLCTMVLGFAFVSYVLFGKKG